MSFQIEGSTAGSFVATATSFRLHRTHLSPERLNHPEMREEGLRGKTKERWKPRTTDSGHTRPVAENVLQRRSEVTNPVPAWVSDITYIETREGWLYLAVVLSVQTRQPPCCAANSLIDTNHIMKSAGIVLIKSTDYQLRVRSDPRL